VALGENPGEHRQGFFGAIFFVADEEHDVFASTGTFAGGEFQPARARGERVRGDGWERENESGKNRPEMEMTLHRVRFRRLHRR
jgi:hypothetical protein